MLLWQHHATTDKPSAVPTEATEDVTPAICQRFPLFKRDVCRKSVLQSQRANVSGVHDTLVAMPFSRQTRQSSLAPTAAQPCVHGFQCFGSADRVLADQVLQSQHDTLPD